ncbi:MAG: hypothetical protein WCI03_03635 [bacterium]
MELRKNITIEDIPVIWQTNMTDEALRSLYLDLACDSDFQNSHLSIGGSRIKLSLFHKSIPFRDGACMCIGFDNQITAIYRTEAEWKIFLARRSEVNELRIEQHDEKKVEILLFRTQDDYLKEKIAKSLTARDAPGIFTLVLERVALRKNNEGLRVHLYTSGCWDIEQHTMDALRQIPDIDAVIHFFAENNWDISWFESYWEAYFSFHFRRIEALMDLRNDPGWLAKVRQYPEYEKHLALTLDIQEKALLKFPCNGRLFASVIKFWERNDRIAQAIEFCERAIKYSLSDGSKQGFQGRLRRLESKLRRASGI